ncbi:MAG: helix-turn-helix transcriptional regulator [Cyanobacteria bacterium]|nr:helix-turn-helix transcriptional regulator [Cyanobacteriota bacterium]
MKKGTFFSNQLNLKLKESGLKIPLFSKLAGLNEQHCYKLLNGERCPTDETLEKLIQVDALGVSIQELKAWRILSKIQNFSEFLQYVPKEIAEEAYKANFK